MFNISMIELREILADDKSGIEALAQLAGEIWREHYPPIIGTAQVEYMIEKFQSFGAIEAQLRGDYRYFMACCGDQPAGYFAATPHFDIGKMFLSKVYVSSRHRRKGIGMAMLEKAFEIARSMEMKAIYLTVNKQNNGSVDFYKSQGFEITESIITDIGDGYVMDDYVMEKRLK